MVGLEFSEVNVELSVESEGRGHRGNNLGDDHVEVGVGRSVDVELLLADAVERLVIEKDRHLSVVEEPVRGEHGGRVDLEADLGLLAVVDGNSLKDERSETGSGTTSNGVVDDESLDVLGVVNKFSESVVNLVEDLLSHGVVSTGEVVGGILLSVQ